MKYLCLLILFSFMLFISSRDVYAYIITLETLSQSVWVNDVNGDGGEAEGSNYVELEGVSHMMPDDNGSLFRAGTSTSSGTSRVCANGTITSNAYIEFEIWRYCNPFYVETWHTFSGTFLLNIMSESNNNDPVYINTYPYPSIHGGSTSIYDESHNLIYADYGDPTIFTWLIPGNTYLLDLTFYHDVLSVPMDFHLTSRLEFSLVEAAPVPEPASLMLVGGGLLAIFGMRRRNTL